MSRMIDILRNTALYGELLKQVPEEERQATIAALEEQLKPYESLINALPGNALENFTKSLNNSMAPEADPTARPERRPPRRF